MGTCQDKQAPNEDKTILHTTPSQQQETLKEEVKNDEISHSKEKMMEDSKFSEKESLQNISNQTPKTITPTPELPELQQRYPIIRRPAPLFTAQGYYNKEVRTISLSDYKGKYVLLFFFPFDFSHICHQEIISFSDRYDEFKKIDCEIIGCSMDSHFVHMQYCQKPRDEGGLLGLQFPLLSDQQREISENYGVIIEEGEEKGASYRATFIIDSKQILRHANINDLDVNLEVNELLRMIKAFQNADVNGTQINKMIPKSRKNSVQSNSITDKKSENGKSETNVDRVVQLARKPSMMGGQPVGRRQSVQQQNNNLQFHPNLPMEKSGPSKDGRKRSILKKRTLFDRMGGEIMIRKFSEKFFGYVKEDSRINYYFNNSPHMDRIIEHFAMFLTQLMGGPQPKKQIKDLVRAHENLSIDDMQFDAFCEVLEGSLIEHGLDDEAVRELFIFIEPQRDQIVNRERAKPLIDRLGGESVVNKIIDKEFEKIEADDRLKEFIPTWNLGTIKKLQQDFYKVSLHDKNYKSKPMRDIHRQLNVHSQQFDIMLDNLNKSINESGVEGGAGREFLIMMEPSLAYKPSKGKENLYSRLGSEVIIEKIVTVFYNKVLQDSVLKDFFKNVDINKLRGNMKMFMCFALGGPQKYSGKSLRDAHFHLELQDIQFDTFKYLFVDTLKDFKLNNDIIKDIEDFLENLRIDVVSVVPPLTTRLGGEAVVEKIVDNFFDRILSDKRVKQFFKSTNIDTLRKLFKNFMIASLGGINKYTGRPLKDAHAQLNLDDMHFNVIKDHFMEAVKDQKIPLSIVNDVGRVLETFRGEIVMRHSSIHDIIGGDRNLSQVINQTLDNCYKDNTLKFLFKKVDVIKLQDHLKNYITFLLGGPNNYHGRRLAVAHKHLRITDQQFTIFTQYMMNGFQSLGIDSITSQQISNLLEALRGEIIKRPPTLYERLGGDVAVPDAIIRFTHKLKTDKILKGYFTKTDWQKMTSRLQTFFTMITGGPNNYDGPNLKDIHSKISLTAPLFDQFKNLLKDTMFEMGAENNDISEVMNLIETLRTEIIGNRPLSIIDKIGGESMVKKIVNEFFDKVIANQALSQIFKKTKQDKMRNNFCDFIMTTLGGLKSRYKGKSLRDAHWKLNISNQQFNDFKDLFFKTLESNNIDYELKKDIETFWDSLRPQIIQVENYDSQESEQD